MVRLLDAFAVRSGATFGSIFGALFLLPFGLVLTSAGYHTLMRGNFRYTSRDGSVRVLSADTDSGVFWAIAIGELVVGTVLLLAAAVLFLVFIYFMFRRMRRPNQTI